MRGLGIQPYYFYQDMEKCRRSMKIIAEAGFTHTFFPVDIGQQERDKENVKIARDLGLEIQTIHAPLKDINRMWYDEPEGIADPPMKMMTDAIEFCADQEIGICVIHESSSRIAPDVSHIGTERFRKVLERGKELGVKVAIENVRRTNHLCKLLTDLADLDPCYCWDSGHENCYTPAVDHVAFLGEKLVCTHVNDNNGNYMCDEHLIPFDGTIDWDRKIKFLKMSGYDGPLMAELARSAPMYKDMTDEEYTAKAYAAMKKLASMLDD